MYYSQPTQDISSLANWSRILIGVTAAAQVSSNLIPTAGISLLLSFVAGIGAISAGVVTIMWMYRIAENVTALGRQITFGAIWAIFGWLILPYFWIIPALQLNELWKASDPSPNWQNSPTNWKIWAWFATAPIMMIGSFALGASAFTAFSEAQTNSDFERAVESTSSTAAIFGAIMSVLAAGLFIWLNSELTKRHEQLLASASR